MKVKKHFPIIIEQDKNGVFIVECPYYKGCRSYGYTIDEAMQNIREAIQVCMESESPEILTSFIGVRDIEMSVA